MISRSCDPPYLHSLFILLGVSVLHLLGGRDVVLEVTTSVFPCLKTLQEELGSLTGVLLWNGIVVGGRAASRKVLLCVRHDGGVCSLSAKEMVSLCARENG